MRILDCLGTNQDQTVCSCWFLLTECCEHGVLRVKPKFTAAHIDDNRVFFFILTEEQADHFIIILQNLWSVVIPFILEKCSALVQMLAETK